VGDSNEVDCATTPACRTTPLAASAWAAAVQNSGDAYRCSGFRQYALAAARP